MDTYRPSYASRDTPPPPPPDDMLPYLQHGVNGQASKDLYRFKGDSYHPRDERRNQDFSFRGDDHGPVYPQRSDNYRPSFADERRDAHNEYVNDSRDKFGREDDRRQRIQDRNRRSYTENRHRGFRGRTPFHASSRPLLSFARDITPERLKGMNDAQAAANRFRNADEMSDSEEESMNQSDDDESEGIEDYEPPSEVVASEDLEAGATLTSTADVCMESNGVSEQPTKPKWSNAEIFTALPPPDDSNRKKKDVVKLIRKARLAKIEEAASAKKDFTGDDFISLSFGDEMPAVEAELILPTMGQGMPGAPSGPRTIRPQEPSNASSAVDHAPGTEVTVVTASALGPPPALAPNGTTTTETHSLVGILASKKRKADAIDNILVPRPPKKQKGVGKTSGGSVLPEWNAKNTNDPVPWLEPNRMVATESQGFRLHKEICDFFHFVKPQSYEQAIRNALLDRLQKATVDWDPSCQIRCFGSFAAGLYLPNADMDLVVISRSFISRGVPVACQSANSMRRFGAHLVRWGIAEPDSLEIISRAKVPIIKFVDVATNLKVDISFENDSGLIANDTFARWKEQYPAMPMIVVIIKQYLMMRGLNEVANGGLGGFSVTCLVVSLLQNMPRVQTGALDPEQHLGEILLEFLDFYGHQLDMTRVGLKMDTGTLFDKRMMASYNTNKIDRLCIVDPNRPENDISGGSHNAALIFEKFAECHFQLMKGMNSLESQSLLSFMLGANYSSFIWQRQRLKRLYNRDRDTLGGLDDLPHESVMNVALPHPPPRLPHVQPKAKTLQGASAFPVNITEPRKEKRSKHKKDNSQSHTLSKSIVDTNLASPNDHTYLGQEAKVKKKAGKKRKEEEQTGKEGIEEKKERAKARKKAKKAKKKALEGQNTREARDTTIPQTRYETRSASKGQGQTRSKKKRRKEKATSAPDGESNTAGPAPTSRQRSTRASRTTFGDSFAEAITID
ncbi:hypothetical protein MMC25_000261 [Agyrium rufum]|nr:hypothetical protein [Agyrium rufum]